ncbi:MAG: site-specific DNA-methyltransferase [Ignavibacteria bacterium]|nr:site-specific DNA-methyltransferase [Ignavibacteria bacterium]MBT8383125.1 site-specific DNA-methyltransferase [Ignavibacteria bacterium]MBT8390901.1 site-specific DNA-methyltransferase [Ignavibacteria bacterium]NNL20110.1 site-specific DNA-methyltransferase [Ignavibacteriaceae bacterium]
MAETKNANSYLNIRLAEVDLFQKLNGTSADEIEINGKSIPRYTNEFWTSKQRQNNPLHEISYRACFKAELPRFFINLFTKKSDTVYDPFAGRGTTIIESALLGRNIISNDINPLSRILSEPRLSVPSLTEVEDRLGKIKFSKHAKAEIDLSMFFHPETEAEIVSLKNYLIEKKERKKEDDIDSWIRMVGTSRLTGHSKNFFSVYTLPPNQAISPERQKKINKERNQKPEYKVVKEIILKKTKDLIKGLDSALIEILKKVKKNSLFLTDDAQNTNKIKTNSVQLAVTSPPFLDVVNYNDDNWLRCWFNNIDTKEVANRITISKKLPVWEQNIGQVFIELFRITKKCGWVAFEVGEVRKGKINLDEHIVPLGLQAGFSCEGIIINLQTFTKTANIWGIKNNQIGTNTNRIVLFRKY